MGIDQPGEDGDAENRVFWPDHPLFGSNAGQHTDEWLFHYTSVERAAAVALTGQLLLSPLEVVNDPREAVAHNPSFPVSFGAAGTDDERNEMRRRRSARLAEYRAGARIACFAMDDPTVASGEVHGEWMHGYANMSLWAHYGNANQGVCLVFDRVALEEAARTRFGQAGLHLDDVKYIAGSDDSYERTRVISETTSEDEDIPLARKALFRKGHHWSGEAERRILVEDWTGPGQCSLPISDCLKGLVVGLRFPVHHLAIVKAIYEHLELGVDYVAQLEMVADGVVKTVPMVSPDRQIVMYGPSVSPIEWHSSTVFRSGGPKTGSI